MIETTTVHRVTVMIATTTTIVIPATEIVTGITRTDTGRTDTEMRDIARTDTGSRTDTSVLRVTTTSGTEATTDMRGTDTTTRVAPAGGLLHLDLLLTGDLTTEVLMTILMVEVMILSRICILDINFWIFFGVFTAQSYSTYSYY